jgi:hypothetical protein
VGDRRFNRALLGISPQKVSSYLRQLKNLQEKELSELEANVQTQMAEQQRLLAERDLLYARRNEKTAEFDCQDMIMQRLPQALRVLQQYTQQEIAALQTQIEQKRREHQWKIEHIEQQTESYNQSLQALIAELGATMEKLNSTSFDEVEAFRRTETVTTKAFEMGAFKRTEHVTPVAATVDAIVETPAVMSGLVSEEHASEEHAGKEHAGKEHASKEHASKEHASEEHASEEHASKEHTSKEHASEVLTNEELAKNDNVIQFKVKALTEQATRLRNGTNDWSDAGDDLIAQQIETSTVATQVIAPPMPQTPLVPPVMPILMEPVASIEPSSFWGDIGQFVSGGPSVHEVAEDLRASLELPPVATVSPVASVATASSSEAAQEQPAASAHVYEAAASKESEAVSTEIASIRNRYIVGKVAGEDLLDGQSRLIVAKGEAISAEVVEIAEREGKLPDLIVNMKIPGVSIDKA